MKRAISSSALPFELRQSVRNQVSSCNFGTIDFSDPSYRSQWKVRVEVRDGRVYSYEKRDKPDWCVDRDDRAIDLVRECCDTYLIPDCKLLFNIMDNISTDYPCFCYYREREGSSNQLVMPDKNYLDKIDGYDGIQHVPFGEKQLKFFFRGNMAARCLERRALLSSLKYLSEGTQHDIRDVQSDYTGFVNGPFVSIPDHAQYLFLLNISGNGPWRVSYPFLFKLGSVIVNIKNADRPGIMFFEPLLEDCITHIDIPWGKPREIAYSLDKIYENFMYNAKRYLQISKESLVVGKSLTRSLAIDYFSLLLSEYAVSQQSASI